MANFLTFDSCNFEVYSDYCKPNLKLYAEKTTKLPDGTSKTLYEANNIQAGINRITVLPETQQVVISISGKVLPIEHKQLISQNNIEQVFDIINASTFLETDCIGILENSVVRSIDFTNNIEVDNVPEYLKAVSCVTSRNYRNETYTGTGEHAGTTGRVFKGNYKTFKERMLFYDKQAQTQNKFYAGILRIENNRSTFDSIRKDIKGKNTLFDILTSNEKPNLKLFTKILGYNEANKNLYDMAQQATDIKHLYFEAILQQAGNDMQVVKEILQIADKTKNRSTVSRHMKQIEYYKRNKETGTTGANYIQDILKKLSA